MHTYTENTVKLCDFLNLPLFLIFFSFLLSSLFLHRNSFHPFSITPLFLTHYSPFFFSLSHSALKRTDLLLNLSFCFVHPKILEVLFTMRHIICTAMWHILLFYVLNILCFVWAWVKYIEIKISTTLNNPTTFQIMCKF